MTEAVKASEDVSPNCSNRAKDGGSLSSFVGRSMENDLHRGFQTAWLHWTLENRGYRRWTAGRVDLRRG